MTTLQLKSPAATKSSPTTRLPRGLSTLITTECRLLSRDITAVFFLLAFPTVLLVGMGLAIPGMRTSPPDLPAPLAGLRIIDLYVPVLLAIAIATAALTILPAYLATYRETGVLRRLGTTPMRPSGILAANLIAVVFGTIGGAALALTISTVTLGTPLPTNLGLALGAFALGIVATFALGVLIGGIAPKATAVSGIGMLIYFPMMFLAGMWTPGPAMPETVRTVAMYSPLGACAQAMEAAWFGGDFPLTQLIVMVVWAAGLFALAARTFRWR